jgi:hypothetical protein
MTSVVAALGSTSQPVAIDRARIDRQIRELALEQAGLLGDDTDRTRLRALRDQRDAIVERTAPGLPGHRAVECSEPSASPSKPQTHRRENLMHATGARSGLLP